MKPSILVHHVVDGPADAPVVVLSNSLGSTLAMWDPQVRELSKRFRVVRYDLRGHGASPVPPGPYEIEDLGHDMVTLLDHLEVDRAHVCGLSLGGMVAMWVGANAPDRVDRLVLCCTSAKLGPPERWAKRAAIVRRQGTAAVADAVVGRWFTRAFAPRHPELVAAMRAMIASTPPEGYAACCQAIERMDLESSLPSMAAPTLVVVAAEDPSIPPDHGRRIAAAIPGARLAIVEDAAHLANVERPDEITRLMLDHLVPVRPEEEP
jgi:3-oxoadipate enol-lactonase